jgi:uncharacterized Fe-S center protein
VPVLRHAHCRGLELSAVVYFVPPERATEGVGAILEATGYFKRLRPRKRVGIKVHFGEHGNRNHLRPEFVRAAALAASYYNVQPVVIETTALYRGRRQEAGEHLKLAREHGFTIDRILAPIEILDGRHGERSYRVPLDSELVPAARLAHGLRRLRYIINLAHFKGHMVAGFGGVIKNLAMGLAAKAGKLEMHSQSKPWIDAERCSSCGECVDYCPHGAINFVQYVAHIGPGCTGCGGCLAICKQNAIKFDWDAAPETVQLKMVEYARAVLLDRELVHINFCLNVTPNCDCMTRTEKPVMPDVGVVGSLDPVACEQAAWDRVAPKLKTVYPQLKPELLLEAAANTGLGTREYRLVNL